MPPFLLQPNKEAGRAVLPCTAQLLRAGAKARTWKEEGLRPRWTAGIRSSGGVGRGGIFIALVLLGPREGLLCLSQRREWKSQPGGCRYVLHERW